MNGFISIYKEEGASSAKAVAAVKRRFGEKCGHMGTLDPLASGVLPVGIGRATRLFGYLLDKKKTYLAEFCFGSETDTLDRGGEIVKSGLPVPEKEAIMRVLGDFVGEISQIPPRYSAKNVAGKRGYELARRGVEFELEPKTVTVDSINLIEQTGDNTYSFEIICRGGTYIRSLARDIGKSLGTAAYMTRLERTRVGIFDRENSVKIGELDKFDGDLIPPDSVLDMPSKTVDNARFRRLLNGIFDRADEPDGLYKLYNEGEFFGVGEIKEGTLKVRTYIR